MPITFFNNSYFLQSIGWAIANSFWQTAFLWLLYLAITGIDKKISTLIKYYLSLIFLGVSFTWFVVTIFNSYMMLLNTTTSITKKELFQFPQLPNILPALAIIYFGLLTVYVLQFVRNYLKVHFISSQGLHKPSPDIRLFTLNTAIHLGIKKRVSVWLSEHVQVPSVTGLIKPIILLPLSILNNLTADQVNFILLHELAHIKRNDYLLNFIQSFLELILFFNPFAVLLSKTAKKERENCCDDWVITYKFNRLEYAKALLILEEQRQQHLPLILAATNNKKLLLQRIKRLVNNQAPETSTSFLQKSKLFGFGILLLSGIYLLVPSFIYNDFSKKNVIEEISNILSIQSNKVLKKAPIKQDISSSILVEKGLSQLTSKKSNEVASPLSKKQKSKKIDSNEFVLALVNEDEIINKNQSSVNALPTFVLKQEKDSLQSAFVKIEEEQSGKHQINTYYFNLRVDNGKTEIKPLLILKKFKTREDKIGGKKLNFTKSIALKKRIST